MRLDEALRHRWAGSVVMRASWKSNRWDTSEPGVWVSFEDMDAEDWIVVPSRVDFPTAWKAMKSGKRVRDTKTRHIYEYKDRSLSVTYLTGQMPVYNWSSIPVEWMDKKDFEILDD